MSNSRPHETLEGVAVVGVSGRFPGAKNVAEYWRNLVEGVEGISFFTTEELESAGIEPHRLRADNYVKAKGVLEDGDKFDAAFFGFFPREAELMDPQHRIFLECAWEALESAGYDPESYDGAIGLYAGASMNTYLLSNLYANQDLIESFGFLQTSIHNRNDHLTTRVAYELNLKGPSVTVQTACSTSLVAVHLACQSLLGGECEMALAGGVTISVPLKKGYLYQAGGILSPDGHCRAFDARAQGTVDGNGVGVVLLKKLEDAVAEGDSILAVIKGSAVNNDGSLKVGYTAPGVRGQAEVIAEAHAIAGVEVDTVGYIEAHGTGTTLGDPIEIEALTQAFRQGTTRKGFCAVGSVKSNIGHLDAAAGISGLIKTVLTLKHSQLPPSLHYEHANPAIDFENSPFYVNTRLMDWKAGAAPRRAGVSSFGIGGTNAHVVLEEAPPPRESAASSRVWHLLPLSARTSHALDLATTNLAQHLREHTEVNLADVAYTLQQGRRAFTQRRVAVCRNTGDAVRTLEVLDHKRAFTGLQEPQERPITMMFPGQGAQYVNMGVELYDAEPLFREWIDRCAELLRPALGLDLRDVIYPGAERAEQAAEQLKQTFITQPALFVVEYALAQLWMSWGVRPESLIGHSIGEYVAACLAGVFSLQDALRLIAVRGRLMQDLPTGGMLVVPLPEKKVRDLLAVGTLSLAAINAPSLCVVAGATDRVDELERELTAQGLTCRRLHTSHAFHSEMMGPILDAFMTEVAHVTLNAPRIPYVSNVSGTWITDEEATDPAYWVRHLRQAVRFDDGATELFKDAERLLLEVGPGRTLSTLLRQHPYKGAARVVLSTLPHGDERESAEAFMLATLGRLWLTGARVKWSGLYENERRQRVALPTYPFERQRYWIDPPREGRSDAALKQSLAKNPNPAEWFYTPSWTRSMPPSALAGPNGADPRQGWLVFTDGQGLGAQMSRRLGASGHEAITVERGEGFARLGERAFAINPGRREDYERLLKEVRARSMTPTRVVHLWSVTPHDAGSSSITSPEQLLERGFFSLLRLAQALGAEGGTDPTRICVVTNEMQQVVGSEVVCPEKATVLGPCLVIPQEYENIDCQSVDIVLPAPGSVEERKLVEHLTAEAAMAQTDVVVAYRNSYRWTQTFKQIRIESAAKAAPRLRQEGVYLLTGGLGGMALELAEYLARAAKAKLILLGRSGLPAASEWDGWLTTHDEQDAVSCKIRKVRLLESLGAEVLIIGADVTSEEQVRAAVGQGRRRFGEINGVIHAAGVAGGGVIQLKTPVMAADVLAPKVVGTRVLDTVFRDASLDFFILCSSRSAILGGFGQVDYCAANAYLDAFAHLRASQGDALTVAIDWDAWQAVGMLVDTAARLGRQESPPPETYRKTGHPLLDKIISDTPDLEVYSTEVSPATHWVLDDHRIVGTAIMPGTGYLEMARAALERRPQAGAIEIRDAFFLAPLGLRDHERREVRTILESSGDGFEFRVLSSPAARHDVDEKEWQQYSIGHIRYVGPEAVRKHDLQELLQRCREREVIITDEDEIDPDLGPRWQSLKRVHVGQNELLATLELSEEFAADMEQLKLHPALLDRATGTAKHYLVNEGHYLPMSYKRIKINGALPRKIHTYIRYRPEVAANKETITFDIIIMDEHGVECVNIEGFSQKRVNDTAEPIRGLSGSKGEHDVPDYRAMAAPHENDEAGIYQRKIAEGMTPQEGVEAFGRVLASGVVPQVIVSTKDLQASIARAKALTQTRVTEELEKIESLRPAHARPAIATAYAAPGNDTERILTEIMQAMLGVELVGINDNFFELGGDSVLGIQIIARAGRMGIQLTPQQLFQYPTVAELAAVAARSQPLEAVQGQVIGGVPLTPAQSWLFEQHPSAPQHWQQHVLLETRAPLEPSLLEKAVEHLLAHHDALRLRFKQVGSNWRQVNAAADSPAPFQYFDLSLLEENEQRATINQTAAALQASLELSQGPLLGLAYFDAGPEKPGRLLIVIHQLVVDDSSWRILLPDLSTVYRQLEGHQEMSLPAKTNSFKQWAERLVEHAKSETVKAESDHWTGVDFASAERLAVNAVAVNHTDAAARSLTVMLDEEETRALKEDVSRIYHTQLSDVLLTALAQTFNRVLGTKTLLVSLEAQGREIVPDGMNLSRTVGWFTNLFPVLLRPEEHGGPGEALKSVKEHLRKVPHWGLGYGLLRYLGEDSEVREKLKGFPQPEVLFRLRPAADEVSSDSSLFAPASDSARLTQHTPATQGHMLKVEVSEIAGRLQAEWTCVEKAQLTETVEKLAQEFLAALRALITHCQATEVGDYTPSDFPLLDLDTDKLSKLAGLLDNADVDFDDDETLEDEEADDDDVWRAGASELADNASKHDAGHHGAGIVSMSNRNGDERQPVRAMDFSLFFFADDNAAASVNKYQLYLQSAAFADRHGFAAVWTPERHFHANGGLYPSPSVLSAALATMTENIQLRAGSIVLPLHHSIRVTEEWAVIDNLSNGRVGVSFTSGWIPNDFVFFPERFANKREEMFRGIREVQQLWRGSPLTVSDGVGKEVELKILPRPIQAELPIWLTCSGDPEMFVKAGELGVNVLTALLTQSVEETAEKIKLYREARARYGHDPETGQVTLMMHTFVGDQIEGVLQKVRGPLCDYLRSHVGLVESMVKSLDLRIDVDREQYLDHLVSFAFERYYQTASLIGTPARCAEMIERLRKYGVDEVACFIDFGVDAGSVLQSLHHLNSLKELTGRASALRAYD